LLAHDPLQAGESREGDERIVVAPPLSVRFYVRESDRTVIVFHVWKFAQRSSGN
jgi:hypothetical protein